VAWEMMNKSVMPAKPFVALGEFWAPVLNCVRGVEAGQENPWAETQAQILLTVATPEEAAELLWNNLKKEM
jgi:hypothetical protein